MVVLTIVVASVLEAFRFRIHYKRSTSKRDGNFLYSYLILFLLRLLLDYHQLSFLEEKLLHEEVHVSWEEVQQLGIDGTMADHLRPHLPAGVNTSFLNFMKFIFANINLFKF